jgi:hypothetical protein
MAGVTGRIPISKYPYTRKYRGDRENNKVGDCQRLN